MVSGPSEVSSRPPGVVYSHPVRCHFRESTFPLALLGILNTMISPTPNPTASKPGPLGSWEELALRQLRLRRMVELLINGCSYRAIAEDLGVAYTTVLRMKLEAARVSTLSDVVAPVAALPTGWPDAPGLIFGERVTPDVASVA